MPKLKLAEIVSGIATANTHHRLYTKSWDPYRCITIGEGVGSGLHKTQDSYTTAYIFGQENYAITHTKQYCKPRIDDSVLLLNVISRGSGLVFGCY